MWWNKLYSIAGAGLIGGSVILGCSTDSSTGGMGVNIDVTIVKNASTKTTTAFSPNPFTVSLADGGKVVWYNGDYAPGYGGGGTSHHLVEDNALFDSGAKGPRTSYSFTFTVAGAYTYHCSIHPTMIGTITVTP
jgi:plastocyanin